jgi:dihydrofolate reductase
MIRIPQSKHRLRFDWKGSEMKVIAIAAVARNGVIGSENALPWNIPEDMRFFRESTKNHVVIMGRKTFDSMGRPLPHRENAVISRNPDWSPADPYSNQVRLFPDVSTAIRFYREKYAQDPTRLIFIIGGAQIYAASMDELDEIWLTEIQSDADGDVRFPFYGEGGLQRHDFKRISSRNQQDSTSLFQYQFNVYSRQL